MSAIKQLLGGLAGAFIGWALTGFTNPLGAQLGFLAGSFIAGALFAEGTVIEGPKADELRLTGSAYGKPIPILFGTSLLPTNVIWATDPPIFEVRHEESTGSNGFFGKLLKGPKITTVSFTYEATFAVMLCEVAIGDAATLLKVYFNDELVADYASTTGPFIHTDFRGKIRFHDGSQDQAADPDMVAAQGAAATPAYRGRAYIVFSGIPVNNYGRSVPRVTAVVSAKTAPDAYPNIEIDPTAQTGVGLTQWGPDGKTIWINTQGQSAAGMVVIDAASGTILREANLEFTPFGVTNQLATFSSAGDKFYIVHESSGSTEWIAKFDVESLEMEAVSEEVATTGDPRVIRVFGQSVDKICVINSSNGEVNIVDALADVGVLTLQHPTMAVLDSYDLDNYLTGTGWRGYALTQDKLGYLWLVAYNIDGAADSLAIVKLDRGFGFPLNTYVLAGYYDTDFAVGYDIKTNSLIVASLTIFFRWSLDSAAIVVDKGTDGPTTIREASFRSPLNGSLWVDFDNDEFEEYDTATLNRIRKLNSGNWTAGVMTDALYDPQSHAVWRTTSTHLVHKHLLDRIGTPGTTTLKEIVDGISTRGNNNNLVLADLGTTELTDVVLGYPLTKRGKKKSFIEPLAAIFFFDLREEDWMLDFIKRGGAAVVEIPESDLGAYPTDSDPVTKLGDKFIDQLQLPQQVELTYIDGDAQYEQGVQSWKRPTEIVDTEDLKTIHVGVVLTANTAKQMVHKIMKLLYTDRDNLAFTLTRRYSRLSVADVVRVVKDGIAYTANIAKLDRGANGVIEVLASTDEISLYTSTITGAPQDGVVDESLGAIANTAFRINDIPAIRTDDAGFNVYAPTGAIGTLAWGGAVIHRSEDGIDFSIEVALIESSKNSSLGIAAGTLGTATAWVWDRVNTLTIRLFNGTLTTVTEAALLNGLSTGVNTLIVGNEIIQCATVVDNGDGSITVSDLLRGRRGTELEIDNHSAGDLVTVVDFAKLVKAAMVEADVTKSLSFVSRNFESIYPNLPTRSLTYKAAALMPMAVNKVNGSIASDDWTFTFHRRSRATRARPFLTPSIGENGEHYECDILTGPGGTVVRTIDETLTTAGSVVDPSVPSVFYDSVDQTTDFGGAQTEITFRIYQMSGSAVGDNADGRGFSNEVTLPRTSYVSDPDWASVVTLLRFNGRVDGSTTFKDYSDSAHTFTVLDTFQIDTAQAKFGPSSGLGDGSDSGLEINGTPTDYDFGTGNFTIAAWLRMSSLNDGVICSRNNEGSDTSGFLFWVNGSFIKWEAAAGAVALVGTTPLVTADLNTWIHFEVSRVNGVTRGYMNGKKEFESSVVYDITTSANPTNIAVRDSFPAHALQGWIGEYIAYKGVGKHDTVSFDVPTTASPRR